MSEDDYTVGYKRPPKHTQFPPGRSGNPRGRLPATLNLKTDLIRELSERIPIREGDRRLRVSKQRALLKAVLAKGLSGDTRAANTILQLVAKTILPDSDVVPISDAISQSELSILDDYVEARMQERLEGLLKPPPDYESD